MQKVMGWAACLCVVSTSALAAETSGNPAEAERPPQVRTELGAGIAAYGIGFGFEGGRWGDLLAVPMLEGRGSWRFLAGDASVLLNIPTAAGGTGFGARATLRVGYTNDWLAILAGPSIDYGTVADPAFQVLPSVRAEASFGGWGLSAGLFDYNALALAHLTAEIGDYGVGYVAPVGITAHARFWMTPRIALRVQGLAATILNVPHVWFTVGVVLRPNRSGGTP